MQGTVSLVGRHVRNHNKRHSFHALRDSVLGTEKKMKTDRLKDISSPSFLNPQQ